MTYNDKHEWAYEILDDLLKRKFHSMTSAPISYTRHLQQNYKLTKVQAQQIFNEWASKVVRANECFNR